MTTFNRSRMLIAGALLIAMTAPEAMAAGAGAKITSGQNGFLTQSSQLATSGGSGQLTAALPHLRLDVVLTEIQNVAVAGAGVVGFAYPHASVKIASKAAAVSIPAAADPPREFATPTAGNTWHLADNPAFAASVNPLFVGVIENGCGGAPAMFDLKLDSKILAPSAKAVLGEVHLADSVFGAGQYNLEYTVRASDGAGNVSDITFRGHAQSYCTGKQLSNLITTGLSGIVGDAPLFQVKPGTSAADSITCRPGTSNWCANGFQIQCERQDGALSSEPDGGVTCTYPESESDGTRNLTAKTSLIAPPARERKGAWVNLTCNGNCDAFAASCDKAGGGLSSEPDGGTTCTVQDNTCSGCD